VRPTFARQVVLQRDLEPPCCVALFAVRGTALIRVACLVTAAICGSGCRHFPKIVGRPAWSTPRERAVCTVGVALSSGTQDSPSTDGNTIDPAWWYETPPAVYCWSEFKPLGARSDTEFTLNNTRVYAGWRVQCVGNPGGAERASLSIDVGASILLAPALPTDKSVSLGLAVSPRRRTFTPYLVYRYHVGDEIYRWDPDGDGPMEEDRSVRFQFHSFVLGVAKLSDTAQRTAVELTYALLAEPTRPVADLQSSTWGMAIVWCY
jgi:hypothetical protein